MITIVNLGKNQSPFGVQEYELRINAKVICKFTHNREDGLGRCLLEASKAVEKAKWLEFAELIKELK